ncbi:FAD-binding oxidoreductase [Serratia ureilytica]
MEEQTGWDIVVIGGGVVGCAVFRKFCLMGARTLLLEKGGDILSGASKANSALLHTGFDAPSGSLSCAACRPATGNLSPSANA